MQISMYPATKKIKLDANGKCIVGNSLQFNFKRKKLNLTPIATIPKKVQAPRYDDKF